MASIVHQIRQGKAPQNLGVVKQKNKDVLRNLKESENFGLCYQGSANESSGRTVAERIHERSDKAT